jgi:prolyl-tRNA synthetase
VLADSGEDAIAFSDGDAYAANVEKAEAVAPAAPRAAATKALAEVETPRTKTIETLTAFLSCGANQVLKTLVVDADDGGLVALCLRGDHELNAIKAQKLAGVANPLHLAAPERIVEVIGCEPGFIGPVGLAAKGVRVYADHSALALADFVCGANRKDYHLAGVNWGRDLPEPTAADLRNVVDGDPSPTGTGVLRIARGIEVGHIFQLGQKYSAAMKATVLDAEGKDAVPFMGCYGIGVTRVVAAAIEQNHDERGIIWPDPIAPYQVVVVPLAAAKSPRVKEVADKLYADLQAAGVDVLLDDRDARPGVKFADAELWGIPHRVVVAERGLEAGTLEYRHRRAADNEAIPQEGALAFLRERLGR